MYTSGTVYKIDVRSGDHGDFVWIADPDVKHEGNIPRTRGIALWEDLVINNLPDGCVIAINRDGGEIVWDKQIAKTNEFGTKERFNSAPVTAETPVAKQSFFEKYSCRRTTHCRFWHSAHWHTTATTRMTSQGALFEDAHLTLAFKTK